MKKTVLVLAMLMMSGLAQAEETAQMTTGIILSPSIVTSFTSFCSMDKNNCRQLAEAKDDAAEFLATNGDVRSAKLQNAFNLLRQADVNLQASDLELAEGILALK